MNTYEEFHGRISESKWKIHELRLQLAPLYQQNASSRLILPLEMEIHELQRRIESDMLWVRQP